METTRKSPGRPALIFTPDDHLKVRRMSGVGFTQAHIAIAFGITRKTLRKHFRAELHAATIHTNYQVISTLFEMATSGKCASATIFWAKTRCKFTPEMGTIPDVSEKPEQPDKPAARRSITDNPAPPPPPPGFIFVNNDGEPLDLSH